MGYGAAVFDMDGTILDTLDDLNDALNHTMERCGFPKRTLEETRRFVGNGIRKLIERAVPEDVPDSEIDGIKDVFMEYYEAHCADKTRPYKGIPELIKSLKNAGVKTAVVSNKADVAVQELCEEYFKGLFDVAIGEWQGIDRKPAPDMVNKALEALFISDKRDAVYIGDSDVDLMTAKNSGLECIAVKWGFRDEAFLREHGAGILVDAPEDLYDLIVGNSG